MGFKFHLSFPDLAATSPVIVNSTNYFRQNFERNHDENFFEETVGEGRLPHSIEGLCESLSKYVLRHYHDVRRSRATLYFQCTAKGKSIELFGLYLSKMATTLQM